jgi:hypothetical protein
MGNISAVKILDATAPGNGETHFPTDANLQFQLVGETSAAAGAASVVIEGHCLKGDSGTTVWETIDTLSLTLGVVTTSDIGASTAPFYAVRARLASISGTGATVRCYMAVDVR